MTGYPGGYPPPAGPEGQQPPQEPFSQQPFQQPPQGYNGYPYGPGGYGYGYGGPPPPAAPRNGLGITALILGIVGLLAFWSVIGGVLFGAAAVIVGIVARNRAKRGEATNGGVAIAGIALGALAVVVSIAFIAVWVGLFEEVGGTDYLDCVQRAGSDEQALDGCIQRLTDRVNDEVGTTAPTR
ncbi:DUF4190 domain-containing protein [Mycolicibacterium sediminis]|uniref:DUF4190 domain-containing protein n=1 Tax=Mycolicibacterium sediminis TaxID=1286180 RepID=A0A7I7QU11_9MYCO|nr:DUF4190 domain-containing protein [Mycolicibacterium sediminis]BBY29823.1 hypothetical protein MSEDJ_39190 [Mycolicibacterium sediminis]